MYHADYSISHTVYVAPEQRHLPQPGMIHRIEELNARLDSNSHGQTDNQAGALPYAQQGMSVDIPEASSSYSNLITDDVFRGQDTAHSTERIQASDTDFMQWWENYFVSVSRGEAGNEIAGDSGAFNPWSSELHSFNRTR